METVESKYKKKTYKNRVNGSRIKITLSSEKGGVISYQYHHQILGLIYNFLKTNDPDYAEWVHEEGYCLATKNTLKKFKLFCFSGISFHCRIKTTKNGFASLGQTPPVVAGSAAKRQSQSAVIASEAKQSYGNLKFSFQIASPLNQFLQHLIMGLFQRENSIYIGKTAAIVETVESLPEIFPCHYERPQGVRQSQSAELILKPLESPIFVKKPMPSGQYDKYLFPGDEEYEYYLNKNLKDKYFALFNELCPYEDLKFDFYDTILLQRSSLNRHCERPQEARQSHKKLPTEKVIEIPSKKGKPPVKIKGTLKPFRVTGHPELIKIGLYCGFGANSSVGCGYVEVVE